MARRQDVRVDGMSWEDLAPNYAQWMQDTATRKEKSRGLSQAVLAASGVSLTSDLWNRTKAQHHKEAVEEIEGYRTGVTGQALTSFGGMATETSEYMIGGHLYDSETDRLSSMRKAGAVTKHYKDAYNIDLQPWEAVSMAEYGEVGDDILQGGDYHGDYLYSNEELASYFNSGLLTEGDRKPGRDVDPFAPAEPFSQTDYIQKYLETQKPQEQETPEEVRDRIGPINVIVG